MKNYQFDFFTTGASYLVKSIQRIKSKKMAQYDLKGTTTLCLCKISNSAEGMTAGELAEKCEIDKAQVSRCMAELMAKEYVYRDVLEGHCYRQKYRLTDAGEKIADDIMATMSETQQIIYNGLSTEEVTSFYQVMEKICTNVKNLLKEN
ncbi:MAG: MarR family transcriptional regulator [Ruminococcaceae bacterium]|nr:MarR family transcriptional regulator [Oscillospiraceae bacterium]